MTDSFDPRTHNARSDELAGRVIAITGASSGIGRAVAIACARYGATVILIGRNARKLETVHGEIEAAGSPEPTIAVLDLEKAIASDYDKLASAVAERFSQPVPAQNVPGRSVDGKARLPGHYRRNGLIVRLPNRGVDLANPRRRGPDRNRPGQVDAV